MSEKKSVTKSEKPAEVKTGAKSFLQIITDMMCEQKHTDEMIIAAVEKAYPDERKGKAAEYLASTRSHFNNGKRTCATVKLPIVKLAMYEGKIVPASTIPKSAKTAKPKIDHDNDPLKKIGGIDLSKKPAEKSAVVTAKAPKPPKAAVATLAAKPAPKAPAVNKVITKKNKG